jgi:hypothetical protein
MEERENIEAILYRSFIHPESTDSSFGANLYVPEDESFIRNEHGAIWFLLAVSM